MQTVDSTYKRIFRDQHHITEVRASAGGVTYGIDKIYSARRERRLFAGSFPSIGNCVAATLELTIIPESRVERLAPIAISTRLVTFDGTESTDWKPAGTFYADTRSEAQGGEEKTFTAFDALLKADIPYLENAQVAAWPATDEDVAEDIAALMGITLDSRTVLAGYDVPLPEQDWTAREVLGYIAAANCGNWIVTDDNKLYLVPFRGVTSLLGTDSSHALLLGDSFIVLSTGIKYEDTRALLAENETTAIGFGSDFVVMNGRNSDQTVMGGDFTDIRQNAASCQNLGLLPPFSGVRLYWDKENSYEDQEVTENNETTTERVEIVNAYFSGDETGRVLEALCPWATQAMADAILANIEGYCWQGAVVEGAEIPPAAELGDAVICDGVVFSMAKESVNFNGAYAPTISAPADEEVDEEYPYEGETERQLARKVTLSESYYGFRVTRENGIEVVNIVDGVETTRMILNSSVQAFYNPGNVPALYFDIPSQKYKFKGNVIITEGSLGLSSKFSIYPPDATETEIENYQFTPDGFNLVGRYNNGLYTFLNIHQLAESVVFESPTDGNAAWSFPLTNVTGLLNLHGKTNYLGSGQTGADAEIATLGDIPTLPTTGPWKAAAFEIAANTNKYIKVERDSTRLRTGMLWLIASNSTRMGYYMFARGTGSTGTIILKALHAVTQSGMSVAVSTQDADYIAITGATGYTYGVMVWFTGDKPDIVSALPT